MVINLGISRLFATGAAICGFAPEASAWGDDGHRIVCEIARSEVKAATERRIEAFIGMDPAFSRFADASDLVSVVVEPAGKS